MNDGVECPGCLDERERRRRARLAELTTIMFFIVARPINLQTRMARRDIVKREPPRWKPDRAFARFVGDPVR